MTIATDKASRGKHNESHSAEWQTAANRFLAWGKSNTESHFRGQLRHYHPLLQLHWSMEHGKQPGFGKDLL